MPRLLVPALLALLTAAPALAQIAGPVALPSVTGPIPVTADSYPLMASNKLQVVVDLPAAGYVEEEFFVSGRANVYDWAADGGVMVKTPGAPYTTRIMLRRPADPARFSGNVISRSQRRRVDFSFSWGVSHDYFMENGDAWVAITYSPENLQALQTFNPTRYAPLSMANPTANERCAPGPNGVAAAAPLEEGLRWDIISQVGALLKAARPGGPLAGFAVRALRHLAWRRARPYLLSARATIATPAVYDGTSSTPLRG